MAPFLLGKLLSLSFTLPYAQRSGSSLKASHHEHSTVISPYAPSQASFSNDWASLSPSGRAAGDDGDGDCDVSFRYRFGEAEISQHTDLSDLCKYLGASPLDLLYLSTGTDGERGVYVSRRVEAGDVILRMPLQSCLRDDKTPTWLSAFIADSANGSGGWETRLAASLLDLKLRKSQSGLNEGLSLWLSMLPDRRLLHASLPVHWSEETLANTKCTALELAADTSYFARAEAVREVVTQLKASPDFGGGHTDDELQSKVHDAFDLIQTRSCRVERADGVQWGAPLRILAPIFDFINHGSNRACSGDSDGCANSSFGSEGGDDSSEVALVVRATRDIEPHDEVLLDYGDSARPAWKCLNNYGFVPNYYTEAHDDDEGAEDDNVAEIFIYGKRYEVSKSSVPVEMVEIVSATLMAEERGVGVVVGSMSEQEALATNAHEHDDFASESVPLTIAVALRIAKRLSDVAFQLILEPEIAFGDDDEDDITPEAIVAAKLAASLRWSQHQVLLACAVGLRDFAAL